VQPIPPAPVNGAALVREADLTVARPYPPAPMLGLAPAAVRVGTATGFEKLKLRPKVCPDGLQPGQFPAVSRLFLSGGRCVGNARLRGKADRTGAGSGAPAVSHAPRRVRMQSSSSLVRVRIRRLYRDGQALTAANRSQGCMGFVSRRDRPQDLLIALERPVGGGGADAARGSSARGGN